MTRRILLTILLALALVVTASAIIEAYGEARELAPAPSPANVTASGVPTPAQARTAVVGALVEAQRLRGVASWMPAKYGRDYLAMRLPRGTRVTICAATCWDGIVNDYGPSKRIHPDRIADIAVGRWEAITGLDRSAGVARVTVAVGGPVPTLPPTSTEGDQ